MELNYKEYGEDNKKNMIILHGLLGSLDNWHLLATQLGEGCHVFVPDARNHGKSPHSDEFSYEAMAQDLKEFMQARHIESATLIGHSMGGKTAMRFALDNPECVEHLIVVDMAPKEYPAGHDEIFEALSSLNIDKITSRKEAEEKIAEKIPQPGVRLFLLKNLARKDNGGYQWKMNLEGIRQSYEKILKKIEGGQQYRGNTLFIRGANSDYLGRQDMKEIRKLFPFAEMEVISDAGHWVHADNPEEFLEAVINFIN